MSLQANSSPKPRVLIIPAAGRGVRFKELGRQYPKCILPVNGTPIIVKTLDMLTRHVQFDDVIVPCVDQEAATLVGDTLAAHGYKDAAVIVIGENKRYAPSPVLSLTSAMEVATWRSGEDVDVTVFLSDMVPATDEVAYDVATMSSDTWAVVPKADFSRWCMVAPNRIEDKLTFYDKPKEKPPTVRAAVGVYRYSSANEWIDAALDVLNNSSGEVQFSQVVEQYQWMNNMYIYDFKDEDFVDFGTLEEYLRNKGISNKCRSFNSITLDERMKTVTKSSTDYNKVMAEANWMQNLPAALKEYAPVVRNVDPINGEFTMSQVRSTNLRDIALYIDRSYETWVTIFERVRTYLNDVTDQAAEVRLGTYKNHQPNFWKAIYDKTASRVQHDGSNVQNWVYEEFSDTIDEIERLLYDPPCYYHGDLHFANMFYCFHYDDLVMVDPRGEMRGSVFYDLAKLAHSVYGRYDYIDADLYSLTKLKQVTYYDRGHENIEKAFEDVILVHLTPRERRLLLQLTASLFFSMIPLHKDNPEHCELFEREGWRMIEKANAIDIGH